jgi:hypothetical protein
MPSEFGPSNLVVLAQGASANYQSSSKILQTRTRTMEETEKLLSAWILDQEQQG